MKALLVSAAAAGLLIATPAFAQAGPTATANANADAEIVQPISVKTVKGLSFGRLAAFNTASTVTVDASGNLAPSAPGMVISGSTGSAAEFAVKGAPNLAYSTSVPATVTLNGAGAPMTANLSKSGGNPTLDANGDDSFKVVGALTVNGNQAAGAYTGSFQVSVQYN